MRKKGITAIQSIIAWVVGIAALVILIWVFPNTMLGTAKDSLFFLGSQFGIGERPKELQGKDPVPEAVNKFYSSLVATINAAPKGDNCIIDIGEVPDGGSFSVIAYNNKITIENAREGELTPAYQSTEIRNFQPCVVEGTDAVNFHNCLMDQDSCGSFQKLSASKDKLALPHDDFAPYLHQFKGKLCFIRMYADGFRGSSEGNCDPPKDQGALGIDTDCLKVLKTLPICGSQPAEEVISEADLILVNWFTGIFNPVVSRLNGVNQDDMCNVKLRLRDLESDYFIAIEALKSGSKIQLGKYNEELNTMDALHTISSPEYLPYFAARNNPTVLNDRYASYDSIPEERYIFSPGKRVFSGFGRRIEFDTLGSELVFIQKNGNWLVTSSPEVNRLSAQIGGTC